jgi:hypothetical protein
MEMRWCGGVSRWRMRTDVILEVSLQHVSGKD